MAYGFNDDKTKANVGEIYQFAINEEFSNQTNRNVTYDLPDGWDDSNTVVMCIGAHWFDNQFYYGTTYGNLEGSIFDGWIIRASITNEGKCILTLRYKERYTGTFLGQIIVMKVN